MNKWLRVGIIIFVFVLVVFMIGFGIIDMRKQSLDAAYQALQSSHTQFCKTYPDFLSNHELLPQPEANQTQEALDKVCKIVLADIFESKADLNHYSMLVDEYQTKMNLMWEKVALLGDTLTEEEDKTEFTAQIKAQYDFNNKHFQLKAEVETYNRGLNSSFISVINRIFTNYKPAKSLSIKVDAIGPELALKN